MSEAISESPDVSSEPSANPPAPAPCDGPPPADRPAESRPDPRTELLQMAAAIARTRDERLLGQYLRLRRRLIAAGRSA